MLLYALQHNRPALQQALRDSGSTSPMHTLYMLLLVADARIGLRQPLQKDWHISRCGLLAAVTARMRRLPVAPVFPGSIGAAT